MKYISQYCCDKQWTANGLISRILFSGL